MRDFEHRPRGNYDGHTPEQLARAAAFDALASGLRQLIKAVQP